MKLAFHDIADLFPLLKGKDFDDFKEDIRSHGQREPIYLYENKILDGRNRYRACFDLGIDPVMEEWEGQDPITFVLSANLYRRHLDESQRAMIGAAAKKLFAEQAKKRQREHGKTAPGKRKTVPQNSAEVNANGEAREQAAVAVNVSHFSIDAAEKVLTKGLPELAKMVRDGEVAVSSAAEIAALSAAQQGRVVAKGPEAVTAAAKEARAAKRGSKKKPKNPLVLAPSEHPHSDMIYSWLQLVEVFRSSTARC